MIVNEARESKSWKVCDWEGNRWIQYWKDKIVWINWNQSFVSSQTRLCFAEVPTREGLRVGLLGIERLELRLPWLFLLITEIRRLIGLWCLPFAATGRLWQGVVAHGGYRMNKERVWCRTVPLFQMGCMKGWELKVSKMKGSNMNRWWSEKWNNRNDDDRWIVEILKRIVNMNVVKMNLLIPLKETMSL